MPGLARNMARILAFFGYLRPGGKRQADIWSFRRRDGLGSGEIASGGVRCRSLCVHIEENTTSGKEPLKRVNRARVQKARRLGRAEESRLTGSFWGSRTRPPQRQGVLLRGVSEVALGCFRNMEKVG
jgi:hypothetical protein